MKRWTTDEFGMIPDANGEYIRHTDHCEAMKRLAAQPPAAAEAEKRDAERYRKLRDVEHGWYVGPDYEVDEAGGVSGYNNHSGNDLDAAVDAMSASKEGV